MCCTASAVRKPVPIAKCSIGSCAVEPAVSLPGEDGERPALLVELEALEHLGEPGVADRAREEIAVLGDRLHVARDALARLLVGLLEAVDAREGTHLDLVAVLEGVVL